MSTTTWGGVLALPVSPSRDHVLGAIGAPVTLIEYGDYECPFALPRMASSASFAGAWVKNCALRFDTSL